MAVRKAYTIRTPIDSSYWDQPITLTSQSGNFSLKRQITLMTFITFIIAFALLVFIMSKRPMVHGGPLGAILFITGYLLFTMQVVAPTKTQLAGYHLLIPMWEYLPISGRDRFISTRAVAPIKAVDNLIGIKGFTPDNGKNKNNSLIVFNNNDLGEVIELTGNASLLIFGSDRLGIIKAAVNFYRQIKPNVSFMIDTVSSAQRVTNQVHAKDQLLQTMKRYGNTDPNLMEYVRYEKYILQSYVGQQFKAWHQYMVVRGTDRFALNTFNEWLEQSQQGSGLFVTGIRKLDSREMMQYLQDIYGDDVSNT